MATQAELEDRYVILPTGDYRTITESITPLFPRGILEFEIRPSICFTLGDPVTPVNQPGISPCLISAGLLMARRFDSLRQARGPAVQRDHRVEQSSVYPPPTLFALIWVLIRPGEVWNWEVMNGV